MPTLERTIPAPLADVRPAVEAALKTQGFGVLTEIDLQATFLAKLGVEHEAHRILGVCNPQIAKGALDLDREIALLLPCTVTLREVAGHTEVRVADPEAVFTLAAPATRAQLAPLAREVAEKLAKAVAAIEVGNRG